VSPKEGWEWLVLLAKQQGEEFGEFASGRKDPVFRISSGMEKTHDIHQAHTACRAPDATERMPEHTASEPKVHFNRRQHTHRLAMSKNTLKAWFMNEPGVIKFGAGKLNKARQRTYVSLRIPESVARRVYARRTGGDYPASGN
jgi:hypothetical protein